MSGFLNSLSRGGHLFLVINIWSTESYSNTVVLKKEFASSILNSRWENEIYGNQALPIHHI